MEGESGIGLEAGAADGAEGVPDQGLEAEAQRAGGKPNSGREVEEERAGRAKGEPAGGQEVQTGPAAILDVDGLVASAPRRWAPQPSPTRRS